MTDKYTNFNQEILSFFSKLSATQEPLGKDFEKILFDNLWDLYEED